MFWWYRDKKLESKSVEEDEGIEDEKQVIEIVEKLKDEYHEQGSDCFNNCFEEKFIVCLLQWRKCYTQDPIWWVLINWSLSGN